MTQNISFFMIKGATISKCGKYRAELYRVWDESLPRVLFVMHNPSTADAYDDDPTIRRCIQFAKDWGYGGIHVGNLTAYRSTDPSVFKSMSDEEIQVGIERARFGIIKMKIRCEIVVFAHGVPAHPRLTLVQYYKFGYYLKLTKYGYPSHPLYLPKHLKPIKF